MQKRFVIEASDATCEGADERHAWATLAGYAWAKATGQEPTNINGHITVRESHEKREDAV